MKTVTINGTEYFLGSIKTGIGRRMKDKYTDTTDYNVAFVAESLKSGGFADATPDWVDENVDYFNGGFNEVLMKAFEANGFKVEQPKLEQVQSGEGQPPVEAAESITTTSTAA